MYFRYQLSRTKERFIIWLAWMIPKDLAKWTAVRVMTYKCDGNPGERTATESLEAWGA